jgi:hypothetical protein
VQTLFWTALIAAHWTDPTSRTLAERSDQAMSPTWVGCSF